MYVNVAVRVSINRLASVVDRRQRTVKGSQKNLARVPGSIFAFIHSSYFACRLSWLCCVRTVKSSLSLSGLFQVCL